MLAGLCCDLAASRVSAQPPIPPDITVPPSATSCAAGQEGRGAAALLGEGTRPGTHAAARRFLLPPSGCGYYTALDALRGDSKDTAPLYPYHGFDVFFDNDFRYLDKTGRQARTIAFDDLKRIHSAGLFGPCNDDWMLSVGGEERVQFKRRVAAAR